jgi:hypothetical protein
MIVYPILLLASCWVPNNRKMDTINTTLSNPYFTVKDSSIEFTYKGFPNSTFSRDTEILLPVSFKTELPLGLLRSAFMDASQFSFIYPCKQGIFIETSMEGKSFTHMDSICLISKSEMKNLIENNVGIKGAESVNQIIIKRNRENYLIYRNGIKVLLINFKKKNAKKISEKIYNSLEII